MHMSIMAQSSTEPHNPNSRDGDDNLRAHLVLGPGVTGADDCCLLVPCPPVCWPVIL